MLHAQLLNYLSSESAWTKSQVEGVDWMEFSPWVLFQFTEGAEQQHLAPEMKLETVAFIIFRYCTSEV